MVTRKLEVNILKFGIVKTDRSDRGHISQQLLPQDAVHEI